jgi:magnesium-transporting ATPase (P-type)
MLWINLIMDSLASLALATEPPTEALLKRDPVNRSASMITKQMWCNMIGQSFYQLVVCIWLLFWGYHSFGIEQGHLYLERTAAPSQHYTILFNVFVMMTLFNEVNCRKLEGEWNVFAGIFDNFWFVGVLASTFVFQCVVTQFGGRWIKCYEGGLTVQEWLFCIVIGVGSLAWQILINVVSNHLGRTDSTHGGKNESGCLRFSTSTGTGRITYPKKLKEGDKRPVLLRAATQDLGKAPTRISRDGSYLSRSKTTALH